MINMKKKKKSFEKHSLGPMGRLKENVQIYWVERKHSPCLICFFISHCREL